MKEAHFLFKNRLRNILIISYWIIISMSIFFISTHYNLIINFVSLIIISLIIMALIWPIKCLKIYVYVDVIDFKEIGWHPNIKNEFGVAFENIYEYKIDKSFLSFNWLVLKRKNGKTIRRLLSLSNREFKELSNILKERVIINNASA